MLLKSIKTVLALAGFVAFVILVPVDLLAKSGLAILNSEFDESKPLVSADGNIMFFNSSKIKKDNQDYYGYDVYDDAYRYDYDIYYSLKINGEWTKPVSITEINTDWDDGVVSISPDGNTIYFASFKDDYSLDGGPFYKAELRGNSFTNIQGLGGKLTEFFTYNDWIEYDTPDGIYLCVHILGASISPDGKEFYFATDLAHKYGKTDIWVSSLSDDGWLYPVNLGSTVNITNAKNREPQIAYDNRTLFFSTDGLPGYGGTDIYYSEKTESGWKTPQNLGSEINTDKDDYEISIPATGNIVYLVRKIESLQNIESVELPTDVKWLPSYSLLFGKIFDEQTKLPVEADVAIFNETLGLHSYSTWNNSVNGYYSVVLQLGAKYSISIEAENYVPMSYEVDLTSDFDKIQLTYDFALVRYNTHEISDIDFNEENSSRADEFELVSVYPNPVQSTLTINFESIGFDYVDISVRDISGALIFQESKVTTATNNYSINLDDKPSGVYLIEIRAKNRQRIFKITKLN